MEERKGQINIDRLATLIGMSGRHLERRFKEQVGMSPKQLCRNLRFKNIFRHLAAYPADSWVSTALACGYHDQAHMIHDFRRFTGTSPAAYFSKPQATDRYFMGNF
jgi:transcriptional regulator GlxA family with amidase domain